MPAGSHSQTALPDILATKLLVPPASRFLVERPRLRERLDECLHPGCRLALISAPAGFGKTTLAAAWVESARAGNSDGGSRPQGKRERR